MNGGELDHCRCQFSTTLLRIPAVSPQHNMCKTFAINFPAVYANKFLLTFASFGREKNCLVWHEEADCCETWYKTVTIELLCTGEINPCPAFVWMILLMKQYWIVCHQQAPQILIKFPPLSLYQHPKKTKVSSTSQWMSLIKNKCSRDQINNINIFSSSSLFTILISRERLKFL